MGKKRAKKIVEITGLRNWLFLAGILLAILVGVGLVLGLLLFLLPLFIFIVIFGFLFSYFRRKREKKDYLDVEYKIKE